MNKVLKFVVVVCIILSFQDFNITFVTNMTENNNILVFNNGPMFFNQ